MSENRGHFIVDFEASKGAALPESILRMKRDAFECFRSAAFPTTHDEDWRFTNVAPLVKIPFRNALNFAPVAIQWNTIAPHVLAGDRDWRIVFVNGRYYEALSVLPPGFTVSRLTDALEAAALRHLGQGVHFDQNAFTALNTAFLQQGAFVHFPAGLVEETPVHLIHVTEGIEDAAFFPRNLIVLDQGSQASIIETYVSLSESRGFTDAVTEIVLEPGSVLQHVKVQQESRAGFHIASTKVRQNRDSAYTSLTIALGSSLSREDLGASLEDVGANCTLNGLYLTGRNQHSDHHTTIDHARPHCSSRELYKGILGPDSRAIFNGRIIVRKDAQHTDARQTNKNILLADSARINTAPQLEILADDVKCNHGATIGHLDEDALFYLRSRAIGEQLARTMLMRGFLQEVTASARGNGVREALDAILESRLVEFTGVPS